VRIFTPYFNAYRRFISVRQLRWIEIMVQSPHTGRDLGGDRGDKAPSWLRRLIGRTERQRDGHETSGETDQ